MVERECKIIELQFYKMRGRARDGSAFLFRRLIVNFVHFVAIFSGFFGLGVSKTSADPHFDPLQKTVKCHMVRAI